MIETLKAYLDFSIIGILGLMSFIMVWLVIERFAFFRRIQLDQYHTENSLNVALTNNLTAISIIGANAPYIGLLGTVLGILITFYDIGQKGVIDPNNIMVGLALALKATAFGLLVAIPAIMLYNSLVRKVEVLTAQWKDLGKDKQ